MVIAVGGQVKATVTKRPLGMHDEARVDRPILTSHIVSQQALKALC
jgi:hypothetical protein